jgi:hypothetical protein
MFKSILSFIGSLFSWLGNLVVKAPRCKGPDTGTVGQSILFTVKSGFAKLSDDYLYSFDFGDSTPSTALTEGKKLRKEYGTLGMTHVFTTPGTKKVKVREKCPYDAHDKWSEDHDIVIK